MNHPVLRLIRIIVLCIACMPLAHGVGFLYGELLRANRNQLEVDINRSFVAYRTELTQLTQGTSDMPGSETPFMKTIIDAFIRSAGLYVFAATLALCGGIWCGTSIVHRQRGALPAWFSTLTSTGAALPALFFASGSIALMYYVLIYTSYNLPVPLQGFGWDIHLFIPLCALCIRSLCSISHLTALSLHDEYLKPHIVAVRAKGIDERYLLLHHIWPAQQQTIMLASVSTLRIMLAELIVIEYLFRWQGIGHLFASAVIAPRMSNAIALPISMSSSVIAACIVGFMILYFCGECVRAITTPRHEQTSAQTELS